MKLRQFVQLLGLKSKPARFGSFVEEFQLASDGLVRLAQWRHPKEGRKTVEQAAVDELRRYLAPGDTAIDIGAHTGDTTVPIALALGPSGCVLALEPNEYVFSTLEENARLNPDKTNIVPLKLAATPVDGEYEFEYSDSGFCNGGLLEGMSVWRHGHVFKLKVAGRNLQTLMETEYAEFVPKLRYIKVDAEGSDGTILESIAVLIDRCRPYVRAEVFHLLDRARRERLFDFFDSRGYAVHKYDDDRYQSGERLARADMGKWRHFDIICIPDA